MVLQKFVNRAADDCDDSEQRNFNFYSNNADLFLYDEFSTFSCNAFVNDKTFDPIHISGVHRVQTFTTDGVINGFMTGYS